MRPGLLAAAAALVAGWAPPGAGAHPVPARTGAAPLIAQSARAPSARAHAAAAASPPTVPSALKALQSGGAISATQGAIYAGDWQAAAHSLTKLTGTRHTELGAVMGNLEAIAAAGGFIPSRLPVLFLTLVSNREWWTTKPLLGDGAYATVPDSQLMWEYYPGQGIEIQWLATFGKANGYYQAGDNAGLAGVLNQAIPLATQRAGGIAWEYLFDFDGGAPPWTSALSQGTAVQAFARGWSRLHVQGYLTTAREGLGIFQTAPPAGVRVQMPSGVWYAQYSFAPTERILNGFVESLVGLYDYTSLTGDPLGEQLFAAGDSEARAATPQYDTGAWSLYDQYGESDLSYHDLLTQFLNNLCERTQRTVTPLSLAPRDALSATPRSTSAKGARASAARAPGGGTTGVTGAAAPVGGAAAPVGGVTAPSGPTGTVTGPTTPPSDPDMVYCQTATRFASYLKIKPVLKLLTTKLQGAKTGALQFTLSKISNVTVTVTFQGHTVMQNGALAGYGTRYFDWAVPKKAGTYTVTLAATDLAGNDGSASGAVTVIAPPKPKPKPKPGGSTSTTTSSSSATRTSTTTATTRTTTTSTTHTTTATSTTTHATT